MSVVCKFKSHSWQVSLSKLVSVSSFVMRSTSSQVTASVKMVTPFFRVCVRQITRTWPWERRMRLYCENKLCENEVLGSICNQTHTHTNPLNFGGSCIYVLWQFWIMVLEKGGDQLDKSCQKWRSFTKGKGGEKHSTWDEMKECWLHMWCLA
jgi:hypothetical protein